MVTYRTHPAFTTKFGRIVVQPHREMALPHQQLVFDVENYLRLQGIKFHNRGFDPCSYVTLTQAMDSHDLERGRRGDYVDILHSIKQPGMVVSISSDVLYPPSEQLELAQYMPNAQHHMINSDNGHDGFLLETKKVGTLIRGFLADLEVSEGAPPASKL